ncbi:MAG: hypothetical protein ABL886_12505 [Rhodoglobus sp.]|jgi:hypothetical protein
MSMNGIWRYLSPEPLLQSPAYVRRMAQTGMSVPTYAYAANNPLRYIDPDGLRVVPGKSSSRAMAAYNEWKASGRYSYIWKSMEADPNVDFVLNDKPGYGTANAETGREGCTADGRPQVNLDFYWKSIDAYRRSNPSYSAAGIVLHELVHGQAYLIDGISGHEDAYGIDPGVTNSIEDAAEYYQDAYDNQPGRLNPARKQ